MGAILGRFRAKESSKEKLERIDDEIRNLENHKFSAMRQQKNYIGLLFIVSGIILIVGCGVYYFYYWPLSVGWKQKSINALPLFIFPLIVYLLKRSLQWYYVWTIDIKEEKLRSLRSDKKKILEKVMETETYKVAKELLEKYDPSALKEPRSSLPLSPNPNASAGPGSSSTKLRYRGSMPPMPPNLNFQSPSLALQASSSMVRPERMTMPKAIMPSPQSMGSIRMSVPPPRLSRPIINQDRGVVEKLVDYIVGDGPSNRYALICSNCHGHNGMALKDEFEYIAFRCCYCGFFNAARKEKHFAPTLPTRAERGLSPVIDEPESDNDNRESRGDSFKISEVETPSDENAITNETNELSESQTVKQADDVPLSEATKDNETTTAPSEENEVAAPSESQSNKEEQPEPTSTTHPDVDDKIIDTDFDFIDDTPL